MERLRSAVSAACELIYSGEQGMPSGCDRVAEGLTQLREAAAIDRRLDSGLQAVESALLQLEDAARDLATYRDGLEYDAARHELVQARLDLLRRLKKKYGGSIESVLQHALEAEQELASLDSGEEQRGHLAAELEVLRGRLSELGERLSAQRREAADALSSIVERELAELNMGGTGFMVSFALVEADDELTLADGTKCGFTRMGIDDVEFLIRPNPGEPFMPLSRIASTGETSRLMLALRCALTREGEIPTLIFDEIDMGIGGRSGEVIGRKLARLARRHQVLCVTHLPQWPPLARATIESRNEFAGARTFVELSRLEGDRPGAGAVRYAGQPREPSMFGAQELLQRARTWKESAA
jgi:DNA repair protein RecN (Recombination protein N)